MSNKKTKQPQNGNSAKDNVNLFTYPTDTEQNIKYRIQICELCAQDEEARAMLLEWFSRGSYEALQYFIDVFCWAKNPRLLLQGKKSDVPFICFPAQKDFVRAKYDAITQGYDSGTEKTREEGVTYLMLYICLFFWRFVDGGGSRVTSWKDDFVDLQGDENTLFGKMRYIYGMFPVWLLPVGFNTRKHDTYAKLVNPENDNSIIGEAPTSSFASSARCLFLFIDELSKIDTNKQEGLWTATADVTSCRLPVWTPKGIGNKAHYLSQSDEIEIVRLHWTMDNRKVKGAYYFDDDGQKIDVDDPLDNYKLYLIWKQFYDINNIAVPGQTGLKGGRVRSEWYDSECLRRSEQDIAQELDIDYLGSGYPFFELQKLAQQKVSKYHVRNNEFEQIPQDCFIVGKLIEDTPGQLRFLECADGWCRLFEFPRNGGRYAGAGDTALGNGLDYSACYIADKVSRNTVASIRGKYRPPVFADYIVKLAHFFNCAIVAPENNSIGQSTCDHCTSHPLGCNMYYEKNAYGEVTKKAGWNTNSRTRPAILNNFALNVSQCAYLLRDPDLIFECKNFIVNPEKNRAEAAIGQNDDCVITRAILDQIIKESPIETNVRKNHSLSHYFYANNNNNRRNNIGVRNRAV